MTAAPRTTLRRASRFTITPEAMIYDRTLSDRAVRIWMILDRMCAGREVTFPSRQMLADALPLMPNGDTVSLASVDRAVRLLCEKGWLLKERADRGDVNAYVLLEGPVVTSDDTPPVVTRDETPRHGRRQASSRVTNKEETGEQEKIPPLPSVASPPPGDGPKRASGGPGSRGGKHRLPADWKPTEALLAYAAEKCPLVDVTEETETFRLHFEGTGAQHSNWNASWQRWMRTQQQRLNGRGRKIDNRHVDSKPADDADTSERRAAWGETG